MGLSHRAGRGAALRLWLRAPASLPADYNNRPVKFKLLQLRDGPLFCTQKRSGFSANTLCQTVNLIYARAGLNGATSHSGRRTLITTLAQKGVGVRVLAAIAGHRDIRVTQAYIDVNDAMMRAAVELAC
jgi:site-specific recombinase XerD